MLKMSALDKVLDKPLVNATLPDDFNLLLNELHPDRNFEAVGRSIAHSIFQALMTFGQFSVDRVRIAGSMGKGTAVNDTDFDLVVFLNDKLPPFSKNILERMAYVIENQIEGYVKQSKKLSRFSVQFKVTRGRVDYDFDLLPAANFASLTEQRKKMIVNSNSYPGSPTMEGTLVSVPQAVETRKRMQEYYDQYDNHVVKALSSSLCEEAVLFLKSRPTEDLNVIRLAKYWNSQINIPHYVAGRSMIIELVAAHVLKNGNKKRNIFQRFVRFLKAMQNFSKLVVVFGHHYDRTVIPTQLLSKLPVVMDPSNPYNNLTEDIKPEVGKYFEMCATQTLSKIQSTNLNMKLKNLFQFDLSLVNAQTFC